jgi:hypothetical protein
MVRKIIGYFLSLIGILGIVVSAEDVQKAFAFNPPAALSGTALLIIGVVLSALGIFIAISGSGSKQPEEVPIYEGKNVVGYRRMKK